MEVLIRRFDHNKQERGYMVVFNERNGVEYQCCTLELPWLDNERKISCIPTGRYKVIKHTSPKFGKCFWVQDVVGRSEILIHKGNYAGSKNPRTGKPDILGCILVGKSHVDIDGDGILDVVSSKDTMEDLLDILPDEFEMVIENA